MQDNVHKHIVLVRLDFETVFFLTTTNIIGIKKRCYSKKLQKIITIYHLSFER